MHIRHSQTSTLPFTNTLLKAAGCPPATSMSVVVGPSTGQPVRACISKESLQPTPAAISLQYLLTPECVFLPSFPNLESTP